MNHTNFFLHTFSSKEDIPFSQKQYSQFKFGCQISAKDMGERLAVAFFEAHKEDLVNQECVVVPSPYDYVQNAASCMAEFFFHKLLHLMQDAKIDNKVHWYHISRKPSYTKDFGFLNEEQRRSLLKNDKFYLSSEFLNDKLIILIDDVYITGAHEDMLKSVLSAKCNPAKVIFTYYGKKIGKEFPEVEAHLNFYAINNIQDFIDLFKKQSTFILIRPIKYVLSRDKNEFSVLLKKLNTAKLSVVLEHAHAEGYHLKPEYVENINSLREKIKQNQSTKAIFYASVPAVAHGAMYQLESILPYANALLSVI